MVLFQMARVKGDDENCFVFVLVGGMVEVATDSAVFYRFINCYHLHDYVRNNQKCLISRKTNEEGKWDEGLKSQTDHLDEERRNSFPPRASCNLLSCWKCTRREWIRKNRMMNT